MAKSKPRHKVTRRAKGEPQAKTSSKTKPKGGSMMSMRSGFKGIAGSIAMKESKDQGTKRVVNIFWWVVTIVLGIVAAVILYNRFGK